MKNKIHAARLGSLPRGGGTRVWAQDPAFARGGSAQIGADSTVRSDYPTAVGTDAYPTLEVAFTAALSTRIIAVGAVTLSPVTDPVDDRALGDLRFRDLGIRGSGPALLVRGDAGVGG